MDENLKNSILDLPNWQLGEDGRLRASYQFKDFNQAFGFVTRVALLAEQMQHHPTITIFYNRVDLELWTHNHNAVRPKDVEMAKFIAQIRTEAGPPS